MLDIYDKKILFELDKDSHISLSKLSASVRKSKQFVLYRIKKLEENGIIKGYKAVIDMSKLGYRTYRIYIKLQNSNEIVINDFINFSKQQKEICGLAIMNGKWDLAVFVVTKNVKELHQIWDNTLFHYKDKIKSYNFCVYEPIYFFTRKFYMESDKEKNEILYGGNDAVDYDEIDIILINGYMGNVRMPYTELARKLNLSTDKVIRRIKNLKKKKIICGYNLILDYEKLGFTEYRVDFYFNSTHRNKELFQFCKQHKNIFCINETIGGADFEIALAVKNFYEFIKIINEIKTRFKDVINSEEYIGFSTFSFVRYIPD